ncbi:MAG: hypothetical protein MZV70_74990 [Desulfobacterales bacterium]|nr:hypothetical protein [Desulfobacterales bacterium]
MEGRIRIPAVNGMSYRTKIFLAVLAIVIPPVLALSAFSIYSLKEMGAQTAVPAARLLRGEIQRSPACLAKRLCPSGPAGAGKNRTGSAMASCRGGAPAGFRHRRRAGADRCGPAT